jgi:hypothetical protein
MSFFVLNNFAGKASVLSVFSSLVNIYISPMYGRALGNMWVVRVHKLHHLERRDFATVAFKLLYDDNANRLSSFLVVSDVSDEKQFSPQNTAAEKRPRSKTRRRHSPRSSPA